MNVQWNARSCIEWIVVVSIAGDGKSLKVMFRFLFISIKRLLSSFNITSNPFILLIKLHCFNTNEHILDITFFWKLWFLKLPFCRLKLFSSRLISRLKVIYWKMQFFLSSALSIVLFQYFSISITDYWKEIFLLKRLMILLPFLVLIFVVGVTSI